MLSAASLKASKANGFKIQNVLGRLENARNGNLSGLLVLGTATAYVLIAGFEERVRKVHNASSCCRSRSSNSRAY